MVELDKKTLDQAKKDRGVWEERATYWHNALPNFNNEYRHSLTEDAQTANNFEQLVLSKQQLEINMGLSSSIRWNNKVQICLGVFNLVLLAVNLWLYFVGGLPIK
ncbi:MAG: hypothetical protein WCW44_03775 [archaeon]|jgi:hypothetical protein